jgi:hypothetical protein
VDAASPDEGSERDRFYPPMRIADSPGVVNDQSLAEVNSMVSVSKSIDDQLGSGGEASVASGLVDEALIVGLLRHLEQRGQSTACGDSKASGHG